MTLNILFFTITFNKRKRNLQEDAHNEMAEKLYEQNKDRQAAMYHFM